MASTLRVVTKTRTKEGLARNEHTRNDLRGRILHAAFKEFTQRGYGVSTLDIARRAKVSKRELYCLFDNKQAMLTSCIAERANRMRRPLDLPAPQNRKALAAALVNFGSTLLREVCNPVVIAVYRLAISEQQGIGKVIDTNGRCANRTVLARLLAQAQGDGLLGKGDPVGMAGQFFGLLWEDIIVRMLLGVVDPPSAHEIERRARVASDILLTLYPQPGERGLKRSTASQ